MQAAKKKLEASTKKYLKVGFQCVAVERLWNETLRLAFALPVCDGELWELE